MPLTSADLPRLPLLPGAREAAIGRALTRKVRTDTRTSVSARVADLAGRCPEKVAVIEDGEDISYGGLLRRVGWIRSRLLALQVAPGDGVVVTGARGADTVAAFLALESIGAVYMPLDAEWPVLRLGEVLRGDGVRGVLHISDGRSGTEAETAITRAAQHARVPLLALDDLRESGWGPVPPWRPRKPEEREPRYAIHTSGSTGRPKGAVVDHRGMMNHLWFMVENLRLGPHDRVGFTAPPGYVISVWQMLAVLLVGGAVSVIGDADTRFPRRLREAVGQTGVTVLELVPSVIRPLIDEMERTAQPAAAAMRLRCLISTGEELTPGLAARALKAFDGASLINAYGATECSDDVTHHVVLPDDLGDRLPAGRPIANAALYLLVEEDSGWRAADAGEVGELWVGGAPVGMGYLDEPELTRERFFADDFDAGSPHGRLYRTGDLARFEDGKVYCLGRADRQVKIAGHRVELSAVQAELARHPAVTACAVTAGGRREQPKVTAHYVTEGAVTWQELQEHLRATLPAPMVPQRWIRRSSLPLNGSGKVDYGSLDE
ncbi:amino acid adenylation domain-containing protein [Streptomyces sp. S.PNR 29]|uniref:amino acid adenylation domain-containing protein n=1 Tax=Streptomyces sp. S.PNR 29 TaxID=2973805 RepID=UPI0025AF2132|nr:amino acid adenylation domain-containing protein [Streptomyces sp. S.PNR 29]MDN0193991.1 amino acid adenylation domain-containing protein [Streptomyces sp. S.PNR 29]